MFTLPGEPGIYERHQTYSYTYDLDPLPAGEQVCRVAVVENDRPALLDVAPGHPLPQGCHWATAAEVAQITGTHPDWRDPR